MKVKVHVYSFLTFLEKKMDHYIGIIQERLLETSTLDVFS